MASDLLSKNSLALCLLADIGDDSLLIRGEVLCKGRIELWLFLLEFCSNISNKPRGEEEIQNLLMSELLKAV